MIIPAGISIFYEIRDPEFSKYGNKGLMNRVFFNTSRGLQVYYDTVEKRSVKYKEQLHQAILDAKAGRNTGWFSGLTTPDNKDYLQANSHWRVLPENEVERIKRNNNTI